MTVEPMKTQSKSSPITSISQDWDELKGPTLDNIPSTRVSVHFPLPRSSFPISHCNRRRFGSFACTPQRRTTQILSVGPSLFNNGTPAVFTHTRPPTGHVTAVIVVYHVGCVPMCLFVGGMFLRAHTPPHIPSSSRR